MKHVTASGSATTVIGTKPMKQESNESEARQPEELEQSLKEWLREIRLEKLMEEESNEKI